MASFILTITDDEERGGVFITTDYMPPMNTTIPDTEQTMAHQIGKALADFIRRNSKKPNRGFDEV